MTASSIETGGGGGCALATAGAVRCWTTGAESSPQTIGGSPARWRRSPPTATHGCKGHTTGAVACWDDNDYGQLGDGTTTNSPSTAKAVSGLGGNTVAVGAGGSRSCAVLQDGTARCWSAPFVGDGTVKESPVPARVLRIG